MYTLYAFVIKQNYTVAVSYLAQITLKFTSAISGGINIMSDWIGLEI